MRVISRKRLVEFIRRYPDITTPVENLYRVLRSAKWNSLQDVRRIYPHADAVTVASGNTVTVVNLGGKKYRLIVAIHYDRQRVFILRLLTHADYSKGFWKKWL